MFCFFFQAEDGIRDYKVTGVQTCALPILCSPIAISLDRVVKRSRPVDCLSFQQGSKADSGKQIGRASCRERV